MKFIALTALVATTQASLGEDCYFDNSRCDKDGLSCAKWEDSQFGPMASCEDCSEGNQQFLDSFRNTVTYECPPKEGESEAEAPTPAPAPPAGEDKAMNVAFSAAALLAASALYA